MSSGPSSKLTRGPQISFSQFDSELKAQQNEDNVSLSLDTGISCKFNDKQKGKEYSYTSTGGKILVANGIRFADFIVDKNGVLHIGKGHSFLAKGQNVLAAGHIKINSKGEIRGINNLSGHYQPSLAETIKFVDVLSKNGYSVSNSWITIYKFNNTKSGYVKTVQKAYDGPVKYLRRHI